MKKGESQSERDQQMLRRRKRLQTKGCGQPLVTGKDKEMDSPLKLLEGAQPCQHSDFDLVEPIENF